MEENEVIETEAVEIDTENIQDIRDYREEE